MNDGTSRCGFSTSLRRTGRRESCERILYNVRPRHRSSAGEYRVKNTGLQPLSEEARSLVRQIGRVTFEHVRREMNRDADRLANEAMDEAILPHVLIARVG